MVVDTWEWWCEPKWMMKIEKWRENASDLSSPFSFSFFLSFFPSLSLSLLWFVFFFLLLCWNISHFIPLLQRLLQQQVFPSTSYLQHRAKKNMHVLLVFFFLSRCFRQRKQRWPIGLGEMLFSGRCYLAHFSLEMGGGWFYDLCWRKGEISRDR